MYQISLHTGHPCKVGEAPQHEVSYEGYTRLNFNYTTLLYRFAECVRPDSRPTPITYAALIRDGRVDLIINLAPTISLEFPYPTTPEVHLNWMGSRIGAVLSNTEWVMKARAYESGSPPPGYAAEPHVGMAVTDRLFLIFICAFGVACCVLATLLLLH